MADSSLIGTLFANRFRIESLIGSGSMGAVYLGLHEILQRKFAIKVIRKNLLADLAIAARFRQEARAASRLEHPHITYVFDFGHSEEGRPYIVMEYVKGPSLRGVLANEGAFTLPRTLNILAQMANALVAAHAGDVIHRDLKPKNIVLTTHRDRIDYVKMLDFGLAKIVGKVTTTGPTQEGELLGTPKYMSPEQCKGQEVDHRTDIYSLGVVAYELLAGRTPFKDAVLTKVIASHLYEIPQPPSQLSGRKDIPPAVDRMVLRCLAKKREDRYPDALAVHEEILSLREGIGEVVNVQRRTTGHVWFSTARRISRDYQAGSAGFVPHLDLPDDFEETTEKDWPAQIHPQQVALRARALEDLACAVRDHGIGSPEISQVLSLKLEAEDRILDVESNLALLDANTMELETKAREREAKLRQALAQLEHERTMLQPSASGGPPSSKRAHARGTKLTSQELDVHCVKLDYRINEMTQRIQEIGAQLEREMAELEEKRETQKSALEDLYQDVERYESQLAKLLRQIRSVVKQQGDPSLDQLFEAAGL
jgi:serine/threonine-protein kinase